MRKFIFVLCVTLFVSCTHSLPSLVETRSFVVAEYEKTESLPAKIYFSVFSEISSDARRVQNIKVESKSSDYVWNIDKAKYFKSNNKQFVGYPCLVYPLNTKIKNGEYRFLYIDGSGQEAEIFFSLNYPELILTTKTEDVLSLMTNPKENIAIFSTNNELIYFGEKKSAWTSDLQIWKEFSNAKNYRYCFVSDNLVCLMPFKEKLSSKVDE